MEELERRLRGRGEKGEDLANRLARGKKELASIAAEGGDRFDHVLMNDDLGRTLTNRLSTFFFLATGFKVESTLIFYRVAHLLPNLGWVDFDLGCSTTLLGQ